MRLGDLKDEITRLEAEFAGSNIDVLELEVYAEYDYGDHCHTRALINFEEASVITPRETAYSDSRIGMPHDDDSFEMDDNETKVVALHRGYGW